MVGRHSSWRGRNDGSRHLCLHRQRGAQCWPCSGGRLHRGGTLCSSFCSLLHRVRCRGACGWRRFQLSSHHLRYACPADSSPDSFCKLYWGLVAVQPFGGDFSQPFQFPLFISEAGCVVQWWFYRSMCIPCHLYLICCRQNLSSRGLLWVWSGCRRISSFYYGCQPDNGVRVV